MYEYIGWYDNMKIIREFYQEDKKCGACNYTLSSFYRFEDEGDESEQCGECFLEMLVERPYEVREIKNDRYKPT